MIARKERKSLLPYPLGTYSILHTLPLGQIQAPSQTVEIAPLRTTVFKPSIIWQWEKRRKTKRSH